MSVLAKLPGERIKLEGAKALWQGWLRSFCHDPPEFARSLTSQTAPGKDGLLVLVHLMGGTCNTVVSFSFQGARYTASNLFDFRKMRDDLIRLTNDASCIEVALDTRQSFGYRASPRVSAQRSQAKSDFHKGFHK